MFGPPARSLIALAATAASLVATGCRRDGCVGGDDNACVPPAACPAIHYTCGALPGTLRLSVLDTGFERLPGPKARAAKDDLMLENDLVRVVIDAPAHAQNLAPSGGSIIDFAPIDPRSGDQINGVYQAAGLLPRDAVHYESWKPDDTSLAPNMADRHVALIFRGHLEGDHRVTVVTRYELRPCEPGVRIRTDLYNGAPDPNTLYLTDGFFWGDQGMVPFAPGQGLGFRAPEVELLHIDRAWRDWPFLAARPQASPDVSYALVPCTSARASGFNSTTLTAAGVALSPVLPGDGLRYERFLLATPGFGIAPAVAEALNVREMVFGDLPPVTLTGRVVVQGQPIDGKAGRATSLLFYEPALGPDPDDETRRTPWSEAVPGQDGHFEVTLPPNKTYRVQPYAFGRPAGPATSFAIADQSQDLGDLTVTGAARLMATVSKVRGQEPTPKTYAELVVIPYTPGSAATAPTFYGLFPGCEPMLGPPHGASPACNRALSTDGHFDLLVPPGQYYVYATRGPFATLDRQVINVAAGDETPVLTFVSADVPNLLPPGVVSGDFHVHGAGSYDSSIPDQDRVVSFLAAGVDVIVASDHDVVTTYASTLDLLGVSDKVKVLPGVELTPNILWFDVPGEDFPKTLGHFNFWPLMPDATAPRNGAPWDELREPGQMMDDVERRFDGTGISQLNHPFIDTKLGRDQGFLRAINYDPTTPIAEGQSFAADVLLRAPGGHHKNLDWQVQEVMTGASRADWLRYRAFWFSLLSQGILRAGAANSDTHSLGLEQVGYPRNLIFGGHRSKLQDGTFNVDAFNADVRAGHMVGTNGPVLEVVIDDGQGTLYSPGLTPFKVSPMAALVVRVAAAPFIPVEELRVFVNGEQKLMKDIHEYFDPTKRFGATKNELEGYRVPLSTLLPRKGGDAWLVVEAGLHQDTPDDTDGDGLPDLPEAEVPGRPAKLDDPRFELEAIAPGVWPVAFSNPFLIDVDGAGWTPPGLPESTK